MSSTVTIPYSKRMWVQLTRRFLNNDFPNDAFSLSENEILLHIDQSVSDKIPLLTYKNAQITGVMEVPDAFLITFLLTSLQQDTPTGYWYSTLPQAPLSLPTGYTINRVYSAQSQYGASEDFFPIKSKRLGYKSYMPMMPGIYYWVENNKIWFRASNNIPLLNVPVYIQMPTGRTSDLNAPLNMPDDIIMMCFNEVVQKLRERFMMPRDNVKDNEPAGNNKLKS
jgi:hypothetical protein